MKTSQILALLLLIVTLVNCKKDSIVNTKQKRIEAVDSVYHPLPTQSQKDTSYHYKNVILKKNFVDSIHSKFSSEIDDDLFVVNVEGGNIMQTKTSITITDKYGKKLYEHSFATHELINGYDIAEIKNDIEMAHYVIEQAKGILKNGIVSPNHLSSDDFLQNSPKEDFNDYNTFQEIKNTHRNIFIYGLGEENLYFLGYSKKESKTVTIISCC